MVLHRVHRWATESQSIYLLADHVQYLTYFTTEPPPRLPQSPTLGPTLGLETRQRAHFEPILCKFMQVSHKNYLFRIVYAYLRVFQKKKGPLGPTLMG
jgi:hypothetical protein